MIYRSVVDGVRVASTYFCSKNSMLQYRGHLDFGGSQNQQEVVEVDGQPRYVDGVFCCESRYGLSSNEQASRLTRCYLTWPLAKDFGSRCLAVSHSIYASQAMRCIWLMSMVDAPYSLSYASVLGKSSASRVVPGYTQLAAQVQKILCRTIDSIHLSLSKVAILVVGSESIETAFTVSNRKK